MTFEILTYDDLDSILKLYIDCFYQDHYYKNIFPDNNTRKQRMINAFTNITKYCINDNLSLSVKEYNKIIAFTILFDYNKVKDYNKKMFYNIFGGKEAILKYNDKLHSKISRIDNRKVLYLLLIAVDENYRRQGIATNLISKIVDLYGANNHIVSDISNHNSLNIYRKFLFDIDIIDDDYYLVIRKNK